MKNGQWVKACRPNCRLGHHTCWNPGCPTRPTVGGDPSCSRDGLQVVLLEFSEGFAELLGVSVRRNKLYALFQRAYSKLATPQLTPRAVLLGRRLCQTLLLCRAIGRFKNSLVVRLPSSDVGGVGGRRPPPLVPRLQLL
ncbi:hypothetical protein Pmani_025671 [Petrolisthes manimaculis]|uniref:Uncharacterized protein n=1 Tax=Petrolisthes manimaculis TaxID=1843537 RepID=A0AAE1P6T4_9EUCA|nr:hypothetical protein Pmani_025671 [Petrolisthes manimaculis]